MSSDPAILPMLAVYVSVAMEAIGDITASAEVSRVEVDGEDFDSRIQGGVLVCMRGIIHDGNRAENLA